MKTKIVPEFLASISLPSSEECAWADVGRENNNHNSPKPRPRHGDSSHHPEHAEAHTMNDGGGLSSTMSNFTFSLSKLAAFFSTYYYICMNVNKILNFSVYMSFRGGL